MIPLLQHIAEHGEPAQAALASDLLGQLRERPRDAILQAAARSFIDGYLNDPHLQR